MTYSSAQNSDCSGTQILLQDLEATKTYLKRLLINLDTDITFAAKAQRYELLAKQREEIEKLIDEALKGIGELRRILPIGIERAKQLMGDHLLVLDSSIKHLPKAISMQDISDYKAADHYLVLHTVAPNVFDLFPKRLLKGSGSSEGKLFWRWVELFPDSKPVEP